MMLAALAFLFVAQEPAAPQGPVSYWKLDETSGSSAANSVAGAPAGTYSGTTVPVPSATVPAAITYPDPSSLSFDGLTSVLSVADFGTFTNMTVSAWINRSGATASRQSVVSYKESGNAGFVLCLNEDGVNFYPGIYVNVGGTWQFAEEATTIATSTWVHLAATYDGVTILLYRDGTQVASLAASGSMTNAAGTTGIGGRNTLDMWYFPGLIDDVRVYSRALSAPEIAVLAAGTPIPTGLSATGGVGQASLSWTAPAGAVTYTYNIKRGTVSGTYSTIATGVSGLSYLDSGLAANTTYFYTVSAVSASESGNATEASATILPPPPKTVSSRESTNLAHRCGCDSVADAPGLVALAGAGLLALTLAFLRRA